MREENFSEQSLADTLDAPTRCIIYRVNGVAHVRQARHFGYDEIEYPKCPVLGQVEERTYPLRESIYTSDTPVHLWNDERLHMQGEVMRMATSLPHSLLCELLRMYKERGGDVSKLCFDARRFSNEKLRNKERFSIAKWLESAGFERTKKTDIRLMQIQGETHNHTPEFRKLFWYYVQRLVIRNDWQKDAGDLNMNAYVHDFPERYTDRMPLSFTEPQYRQTKKKRSNAKARKEKKLQLFFQDHNADFTAKRKTKAPAAFQFWNPATQSFHIQTRHGITGESGILATIPIKRFKRMRKEATQTNNELGWVPCMKFDISDKPLRHTCRLPIHMM